MDFTVRPLPSSEPSPPTITELFRDDTREGKHGVRHKARTRLRYKSSTGCLDLDLYQIPPAQADLSWKPHPRDRVGYLYAAVTFNHVPLRLTPSSFDVVALCPYPMPDDGRGTPEAIRILRAAEVITTGRVSIKIQELIANRPREYIGSTLLAVLGRFARGIQILETGARPGVDIEGEMVPGNTVEGGYRGLIAFYQSCGYRINGRTTSFSLQPH